MKLKKKKTDTPPAPEFVPVRQLHAFLEAPDPAGYQAVIFDETGAVVAQSIPERAPIDFENRRFTFVFAPAAPLRPGKRYWAGVRGPSGQWLPFGPYGWPSLLMTRGYTAITHLPPHEDIPF